MALNAFNMGQQMDICLQLKIKDAGLLLRVLDEGATLHTGHPRRQARLDAILESICRQLNRELGQFNPDRIIE